jgi:DinB superfamily
MTAPGIPLVPPADDKDWTWVLERPCPSCGFVATTLELGQLSNAVAGPVATIRAALTRRDASVRPAPAVWSPLEYACHVRDVCLIFRGRLALLVDEFDPVFPNWDQDETALAERYWEQEPAQVSGELDEASQAMAAAISAVRDDQWARPGRRSNGSRFTVETLVRYTLHDLRHHANDVSRGDR